MRVLATFRNGRALNVALNVADSRVIQTAGQQGQVLHYNIPSYAFTQTQTAGSSLCITTFLHTLSPIG